jgi:hypothetical protein
MLSWLVVNHLVGVAKKIPSVFIFQPYCWGFQSDAVGVDFQ